MKVPMVEEVKEEKGRGRGGEETSMEETKRGLYPFTQPILSHPQAGTLITTFAGTVS